MVRAGLFLFLSFVAALPAAAAQVEYPRQPIKLVVPFAPGGTAEILARIIADRMSCDLGQAVFVETIDGAGSTVGTETVARAKPDGYTLLMNTAPSFAINPLIYRNLKYDIVRDFVPISWMTRTPNVLVVRKNLPANSITELVTYAKKNPGKLNYGSSGNGTVLHLSGVMFAQQAGIEMVHVPYRGGAPAMNDLVGGVIDLVFDNLPAALPQIKAGNVCALAVTTKTRSKELPLVRTLAEQGFPDFATDTSSVIFAPKGTPPAVIARLSRAAMAAARDAETATRLNAVGAEVIGSTPEVLARFRDQQMSYWAPIVRRAGVRIE